MLHTYLPSPTRAEWHLGFFPIRAYALCIIVGVIVAIWLSDRRWRSRGGSAGTIADVAVWAVPFGLVGGRLYNVVTDPELYFPKGQDWVHVFYVWDGGLGIPGAIALGALGAWIGARRAGYRLPPLADTIAPGIAFAQACGRWGNWFNNELYGKRTTLPWGLTIHPNARDTNAPVLTLPGHYQPTFLYECLWDIGTGCLVLWASRRFKLSHGRAFALYAATYAVGREWIEALRIDYAHRFFGLRLNDWTMVFVFVAAVVYFVVSSKLRPGPDVELYLPGRAPAATVDADSDGAAVDAVAVDASEGHDDADTAKGGGTDPNAPPDTANGEAASTEAVVAAMDNQARPDAGEPHTL
jgi:prolipoprotein diacylglyceryl transferase